MRGDDVLSLVGGTDTTYALEMRGCLVVDCDTGVGGPPAKVASLLSPSIENHVLEVMHTAILQFLLTRQSSNTLQCIGARVSASELLATARNVEVQIQATMQKVSNTLSNDLQFPVFDISHMSLRYIFIALSR